MKRYSFLNIFKKHIKKHNISIIFRRENISTTLVLSLSFNFFFFFEIMFFQVYLRLTFLGYIDLLLWQITAISIHLIFVFFGYHSKSFRVLFFLLLFGICGVALYFVFYLNSLYGIKTFLISLMIISCIGFFYSLKGFRTKKARSRNRKKIIFSILILVSLTCASIGLMTFPEKKIVIEPKTNPELIFWTDPYFLPNNEDIYKICREYNIGFMPAISSRTLNSSSLMNRYKMAIDNGVNLYFSLISGGGEPYLNMYNTHEYIKLYKDFKKWFTDEGIFDSTYIKAFIIDAEPPNEYTNKFKEEGLADSLNHFIDEYPTQDEIDEATNNINELVNEIQSDAKEASIIKISSYMDEGDNDGDIELLLRNIYSLDVVWDYSITMIYRTGAIITKSEDTAEVVVENMKKNIFGKVSEDVNVLSAYNFYFRVGLSVSNNNEIKAGKHYTFMGTLKRIFNDSDYMKNREYLDDLDICRHFGQDKVFLYNYKNFIDNYGVGELINLGEHNEQKDSWELDYIAAETQINIIFYLAIAFLDRLLSLENF